MDKNLIKAIAIVSTAAIIFLLGCVIIGPAMVVITFGLAFCSLLVWFVKVVLDDGDI